MEILTPVLLKSRQVLQTQYLSKRTCIWCKWNANITGLSCLLNKNARTEDAYNFWYMVKPILCTFPTRMRALRWNGSQFVVYTTFLAVNVHVTLFYWTVQSFNDKLHSDMPLSQLQLLPLGLIIKKYNFPAINNKKPILNNSCLKTAFLATKLSSYGADM